MNIYIVLGIFVSFSCTGIIDSASEYKNLAKKLGRCPSAKSIMGTCIFDPEINCLADAICPNIQKCCREGCNKICKLPLPSKGFEDFEWPDIGLSGLDWSWLHKSKIFVEEVLEKFWEVTA